MGGMPPQGCARAPKLLGGRAPGPQGPDLDGGKNLDFDIIFFEVLRIDFYLSHDLRLEILCISRSRISNFDNF